MAGYEDIVREIVASLKNRRLAVFCGAGISFNSGLPLANDLVESVLDRIDLRNNRKSFLPPQLPFEAFMETLRAESNETRLLELFRLGEPNTSHILLARLAEQQLLRTICTTNFDGLIEAALEARGLQPGKHFSVAFRDKQFDAITSAAPDVRVFKVHGSVADTESMAITLRQVSHHELSAHRQRVIENLFSTGDHDDVLVLGYSCSDVFDLSPHIESLAEKRKRIFLVEHVSAAKDKDAARVEDLSARRDRHPFSGFARSLRIMADTDSLLEAIWTACLEEPYRLYKSAVGRDAWEGFVDEWHSQLADVPSGRFALAGHLYLRIAEWTQAAAHFEQAVSAARAAGDMHRTAGNLSSLGMARIHFGSYEAAIASHREGIEIGQTTGDQQSEATNAQGMANAYQGMGDLERAMLFHERAAKIAEERSDAEGKAATLAAMGDLATRMGQFEKAVRYLNDALTVAREDANLIEQTRILASLGHVYHVTNDLAHAEAHYRRSLDMARLIGLKSAEGAAFGNIGLIHLVRGEDEDALECLRASREMARASGDRSGEGKSLGSLGFYHHKRLEYKEAIESYEASLSIARDIKDIEMAINGLTSLSGVYALQGDDATARRFLAEARSTASGSARLEAALEQRRQGMELLARFLKSGI